jgi:hypothetical protein
MRGIGFGIGLLMGLVCGNLPAQTPKLPEITSVAPRSHTVGTML